MKISFVAIVALAAPICLAAQQPSATPPANPITASFKARIMNLHRNVGQALDSIPESKFSYKPTAPQMTIGNIATLTAANNGLVAAVAWFIGASLFPILMAVAGTRLLRGNGLIWGSAALAVLVFDFLAYGQELASVQARFRHRLEKAAAAQLA